MRCWMFCDNHFMMYVSQIIMLYTLNLCSAVCQLYRNTTGTKNETWSHFFQKVVQH